MKDDKPEPMMAVSEHERLYGRLYDDFQVVVKALQRTGQRKALHTVPSFGHDECLKNR